MGDSNEAGDRRWPTLREAGVALLAAVLVLALTGVGVQRSHQLDRERRAIADEAALAQVAAGVGVDVERGLRGVASAAAEVPSVGLAAVSGPTATASIPGATAVGFIPVTGDLPPAAGPPILSAEDRAAPGMAAVLDRARDTGDAQMGVSIDLAVGLRTPLVAAVYAAGELPGGPRTSAERRARLSGWVVAPVDLGALAGLHAPKGAVATIDDVGSSYASPSGAAPTRLPDQVLAVAGRSLTVRAGARDAVGWTAPTLALAMAGSAVALGAAAAVLVVGRRGRAQRSVSLRRAGQVRLIGEVAPLVQQSLELAEVLPAVAVQLSDHFGLDGVALSTGSSRAGQTELFSIGVAPATHAKAALTPPTELMAGETLALALQRGGRSVALLQIVAGRTLDAADLESLRALSELVTAAMVNASLYASQQEALRRLHELDGLKTVFLGTASHELRTPATAIAGFASLLTASWDRFSDTQRRDFAGRIAANARSLSGVVQDLLDFSLLDHGNLVVAVEPVDLGALVESVVDRLGPVFSDHAIDCAVLVAPPVAGDTNGLERIVTNLLTNAVKFSPSASTISVSVVPADGGARLVVSDQGPGVPEAEREQVFTRFYRGSGDAVVQTRGVGIGLSLVAEFVARMHGEVTVDDAPGGGARFTVWLPAAANPADQQEDDDASTA
jgi:signal transduction histidine kinase